MKKLFLATFALSLLGACNNEKKDNKVEDTTTTTTTPMSTGWDEATRKNNEEQCVTGSKAKMTEDKAKAYCDCMMDKLEARYPVADTMKNMTMSQMETAMNEFATDCQK